MNLVVDGLLANYTIAGTGKKAILCLHGWADNGKTFESLTKQLEESYRIIALDLPGFGNSQMPPEPWKLDDFAHFTGSFLSKLDIHPYAIVGHSNGGAIAIQGLANGELQAEKLVLLASSGIRRPKSLRNKGLVILAKAAKLLLRIAPEQTQERVKRKLYGAVGSDYMAAEHMRATFRAIVSTDVRGSAKKLKIPALLIYGEQDVSTPPAYGRLFASAIPHSNLKIIKNTGHFVHQEQVYEVANYMKGFLK